MRRLFTIAGSLALVAALAVPLFANNPGWGWGTGYHMMGYWGGGPDCCGLYGRGYGNLTEEQRSQLETLHQKFYDATAPLKDQIWGKSAELNALLASPNPDAEKAKALQKEISDLRAKLAQERINFEIESRKIAPGGYEGRRYGWHMGGHGPGMWWN
jgi:zinc resistance-associated protein